MVFLVIQIVSVLISLGLLICSFITIKRTNRLERVNREHSVYASISECSLLVKKSLEFYCKDLKNGDSFLDWESNMSKLNLHIRAMLIEFSKEDVDSRTGKEVLDISYKFFKAYNERVFLEKIEAQKELIEILDRLNTEIDELAIDNFEDR